MNKLFGTFSVVLFLCLMLGTANATILTSNATVDNQLRIYLSTDDSMQGDYLGDHSQMDNWVVLSTYTSNLAAGVDYYLHVYGYDYGGPSGFIGEFSLDSSTDHVFANNTSHLLTNVTDWKANTSGWGNAYDAPLDDYGPNSTTTTWTAFGGVQGLSDHSAHWIWAGGGPEGNPNYDHIYFSTKISATMPQVPVPSAIILFNFGLLCLVKVSNRPTDCE